jgi:hypothetical protein
MSRWAWRRLAVGLSPTPGSSLALLLLGLALGSHGLGVLSATVLTFLEPAVSAALAALGVLVGLHINVSVLRRRQLIAAAGLTWGATILVVSAGVIALHALSPAPEATPWLLALLLGVCAVPSSTAAEVSGESDDVALSHFRDLDDVLPILVSVVALAWLRPGGAAALTLLLAQGSLIAIAIAFATWLLMTQASTESEQRVFTIGALLLLGGAAAHLSLSTVYVGLLAGMSWNVVSKAGRDHIESDMRYLQHPLLLLLLIFAGARLTFGVAETGLVVAYIALRIAGKWIGGRLAGRAVKELPRLRAWSFSGPGVVAIAIAIDALLTQGSSLGYLLFTIVIAGSLGSELLSSLVWRRDEAA